MLKIFFITMGFLAFVAIMALMAIWHFSDMHEWDEDEDHE